MLAVELETGEVAWTTPNPLGWSMTHVVDRPGRPRRRPDLRLLRQPRRGRRLRRDGRRSSGRPTPGRSPSPPSRRPCRSATTASSSAAATTPAASCCGSSAPTTGDARAARRCTGSGPRRSAPRSRRRSSTRVTSTASVRTGSSSACGLDGSVAWTSGPRVTFGLCPFLVADDLLYVLDDDGHLSLVRAVPRALRTPGPRPGARGARAVGAPGPGRRTTDRPGPHAHGLPGGRARREPRRPDLGTARPPPPRSVDAVDRRARVRGRSVAAIFTASSQTGRDREPAGLDPAFVYDVARYQVIPPERIGYREVAVVETGLEHATAVAVGPADEIVVGGDERVVVFSSDGTRRHTTSLRGPAARASRVSADGRPASSASERVVLRGPLAGPLERWLAVPGETGAHHLDRRGRRDRLRGRRRARVRSGTSPRTAGASAASAIATRSSARAGLRRAEPVLRRARRARRPPAHRRPRPPPGHGLHARRGPGAVVGHGLRTPSRASAAAATRRTSPCSPTAAS